MKVLIVNDYSERIGGTEVYVESLAIDLKKNGHEVSFYFGSDNYKKSVQNGTKVSSYLNRIFSFTNFFRFKETLDSFKPDIIHIHNLFNEISPSILLQTQNIPVVMTLHDYHIIQAVFTPQEAKPKPCKKEFCPGCLNCVGIKGTIFEKIKRFVHSFLLANVNVFIAPSKYMNRIITDNSRFRPITVLNGFPLLHTQPILSKNKLLYVGRLTNDKGIQILLDSMTSVIKSIPDISLTIVGDGDLSQDLKTSVLKKKISKHVTFKGKLDRKETEEEFAKSTIVVIPSIWPENLPTVVIEALSVGRPVVGSSVGGIPEIITHMKTGLLVMPGDSTQLSESIVYLLKNEKLLKSMSEQAGKNKQKFEQSTHTQKIISVYNSLL